MSDGKIYILKLAANGWNRLVISIEPLPDEFKKKYSNDTTNKASYSMFHTVPQLSVWRCSSRTETIVARESITFLYTTVLENQMYVIF